MRTNVYNEDVPAVAENKGSEKDKKPILTAIFAKSKILNQGSMQTRHTNGFQVMEFL